MARDRTEMRVLYLIDSLTEGGAERSLLSMTAPFRSRGIGLHVGFLIERPGLHAAFETAGAQLHCLAGPGGRVGWIRRAHQLTKRLQPDLIHTTLFEADQVGRIVGKLTGTPVVSSLVNVAYGREQRADPRLRRWKLAAARIADMTTAKLVARFHSITSHVAVVMSERLNIDPSKIEIIPRGRDPRRLGEPSTERRESSRAGLGIHNGTPILLAAARQEHQKGLDVLVEAFPKVLHEIPEARLLIAGREGQLTPTLRGLIARAGLESSISLLGARTDVPDLLCAADVCVIPSRWEGLAGIFLEAMAMQTPIVASNLPSFGEMLDGDLASFVPPEHPDALAAAIVDVLNDPAGSQLRAKHGRKRFLDSFTIEPTVDRMVTFYERALASAGDRRA